jgi:hypothetical protein
MPSSPSTTDSSIIPATEDVSWSNLLDLFSLPGHPHIYLLGSFAKRVTFYAQQVRALNLIDALCKTGALYEGSRVGIVGAGVAGVTAAMAAARRGLMVTLIEKHRDRDNHTLVLPRQRLSDERAVHPHVYDWPLPAVSLAEHSAGLAEQSAGLPLMDWKAGTAARVVEDLSCLFDHEQANIELLQTDFVEDMISSSTISSIAIELPEHGRRDLDALILAVGFGEEEGQSYWENDGLQSKKGQWLVSGTGDGGLTDVMRLCIDNFRHAEVVQKFGDHGREAGLKLVHADTPETKNRPHLFREVARELHNRLEENDAGLRLRDISVWLAGTEESLFSPGASILNRLIAAYLLERKAFTLIPHSTLHVERVGDDRWKVTFTDDRRTPLLTPDPKYPTEFDGVVLRHGPKSAFAASCPKLFKRSSRLKRKWDAMQASQDPTRSPLWKHADFEFGSTPLLDVDSRSGPFAVVVDGAGQAGGLSLVQLMDQALLRANRDTEPRPSIQITPDVDLATPHGYRRALRALCRSEIAVFDITEKNPATMLLLGIRSVVRRGITLLTVRMSTTSPDIPEPFDLPDLPFNIRETSMIARRQNDNTFTEALKTGIVAGRNQMQLLAYEYQDLPAYDAVRKLGPRPENHRPVPPSENVLVLSSYGKDYLKGPGQVVSTALGTAIPSGKWWRIVESPSPQLASQKLYAAIRQTQMCVFDWTDWRPNLFFELGVRLAVNPQMPVCILHKTGIQDGKERRVMRELFAPYTYDSPDFLVKLLKSHRAAVESGKQTPCTEARLSPTFTFVEAQRWMDVPVEAPLAVDVALEREAASLIGPDPKLYPDPPLLYRGNDSLRSKAEAAALDRWIAAWYFLDKRYGVYKHISESQHVSNEAHVQRWIKLTFNIQSMLETIPPGTYDAIRQEIENAAELCKRKNSS